MNMLWEKMDIAKHVMETSNVNENMQNSLESRQYDLLDKERQSG